MAFNKTTHSPIIYWSNTWVSVFENYNFQEWWIQDWELSSSPTCFLSVAFPNSSDRKTNISLRSCWKMQICPANTSLSPPLMKKITSFILHEWISSNLLSPSDSCRKATLHPAQPVLHLVLSWFLISLSSFEAMMAGFSHCNLGGILATLRATDIGSLRCSTNFKIGNLWNTSFLFTGINRMNTLAKLP